MGCSNFVESLKPFAAMCFYNSVWFGSQEQNIVSFVDWWGRTNSSFFVFL